MAEHRNEEINLIVNQVTISFYLVETFQMGYLKY
jgi:hypothetical protein